MRKLELPEHLVHLQLKAGRDWVKADRDAFFLWLASEETTFHLSKLAVVNLAPPSKKDAEDVVASCIEYLFRRILRSSVIVSDLCAAIKRKLKQTCIDYMRSESSRREAPRSYTDPEGQIELERLAEIDTHRRSFLTTVSDLPEAIALNAAIWPVVRRCLKNPSVQLRVVELYFHRSEPTFREVAEALNWHDKDAVNRVYRRYTAAIKQLAECSFMQEYLGLLPEVV